jgi:hypothetical protein
MALRVDDKNDKDHDDEGKLRQSNACKHLCPSPNLRLHSGSSGHTGFKGDAVVFTVADTVPNTLGLFRTVVNPHGTDVIDTLTISLSNGNGAPLNPMGLDNIVLGQ